MAKRRAKCRRLTLVLEAIDPKDANSLLQTTAAAFLVDDLQIHVRPLQFGEREQHEVANEPLETSCRSAAQQTLEANNRQQINELQSIAEQWVKDQTAIRAKRLAEKHKRLEEWVVAILAKGCQIAVKVVAKAIGGGSVSGS